MLAPNPKGEFMRMSGTARCSAVLLLFFATCTLLASAVQTAAPAMEETVPPGSNYDKAEFRLWLPADGAPIRAALILVPGSNGDGRPMADDKSWQEFATKHRLALVGCRFTDKPHEQS